jgi:hypothetical protein
MFTGWLNQPFASVPRSADAVTLGGVASRRTVTVVVLEPLEFDHVQDTEAPEVSFEIVAAPHPLALTPAGGPAQLTVTLDVCHAPQSLGPGEHDGSGGDGGSAVAAVCASTRTTIVARRPTSGRLRSLMPASNRR